jgi:hypothetical protein
MQSVKVQTCDVLLIVCQQCAKRERLAMGWITLLLAATCRAHVLGYRFCQCHRDQEAKRL